MLAVLTEILVRKYVVKLDRPAPHSISTAVLLLSILINSVCWVALTVGLIRQIGRNRQSSYEMFGFWTWWATDGFIILRFYFLLVKFFWP